MATYVRNLGTRVCPGPRMPLDLGLSRARVYPQGPGTRGLRVNKGLGYARGPAILGARACLVLAQAKSAAFLRRAELDNGVRHRSSKEPPSASAEVSGILVFNNTAVAAYRVGLPSLTLPPGPARLCQPA